MSSTDTHIYTHSHTNTLTNDLYQRHLPPSSHAALYTPFIDARVYSSYYIWHYKKVVLNDNLCLSGVTCFPKTTVEGAVSCSRRWTHLPSTLSWSVQYNTPVNHDTCCSVLQYLVLVVDVGSYLHQPLHCLYITHTPVNHDTCCSVHTVPCSGS